MKIIYLIYLFLKLPNNRLYCIYIGVIQGYMVRKVKGRTTSLAKHYISVIGSGVVGTATGKGFHKLGHDVTFFDISNQRLETLRNEGYNVASSLKDAISTSEICFICVNTPQTISRSDSEADDFVEADLGKHQDLSQILHVVRDIANVLNSLDNGEINRKRLFVFRSTMIPGTMRNVVMEYLERNCTSKRGKDYDIYYNPEFVRQHSALEDFFNPDRVVIGQDKIGPSSLSDLYIPLTDKIVLTGFEEAEMIKYASNCFLALKISYFNEIGAMCKKMGIDEEQVAQAVSMDNRIGRYGTNAGLPFGGACLPKDTEAFASFARNMNIKDDLIETAIKINQQMEELNSPKVFVRQTTTKERILEETDI
jgi:UDPglucose 6-dehydrogenase